MPFNITELFANAQLNLCYVCYTEKSDQSRTTEDLNNGEKLDHTDSREISLKSKNLETDNKYKGKPPLPQLSRNISQLETFEHRPLIKKKEEKFLLTSMK